MRIKTKWKLVIPFIEVLIISCVLVIGISINRGVRYENELKMAQYIPGISGIGLSEGYRYNSASKGNLLNDELVERVRRDGNAVTQSISFKQAKLLDTSYGYGAYEDMDFSYMDNSELLGTYAEYFKLFEPKLIAGRYFTEEEHNKRVCVIGEGTAIKVFGSAEDSIGKIIKIPQVLKMGEDDFEVVGVAEGELNLIAKTIEATGKSVENLYLPSDEIIMYPLPALHYKSLAVKISKSIWLKGNKNDAESLVEELRKSNISADFVINPIPIQVFANSDIEKLVLSALNIFMLLMAVVAGLNITGIQLILINRKKEEFGLNMALGARRKDIFMKVMNGALKLVLIPAILGVAVGFTSLSTISDLTGLTMIADAKVILSSLGAMGLFIIITGTYPAIKGASIDPIVAIGRTPGFN